MSSHTPGFRHTVGPWIPFAFCVFLCGLVVVTETFTGTINTAAPAFFCFLPMVFFFVAVVIVENRKELRHLSERVDKLEDGGV